MRNFKTCVCIILFIVPSVLISQDSVLSKSVVINQSTSASSIVKSINGDYLVSCLGKDSMGGLNCIGYIEIDEDLRILQKGILNDNNINCLPISGSDRTVFNNKYIVVGDYNGVVPDSVEEKYSVLAITNSEFRIKDTFRFNYSDKNKNYFHQIQASHDSMLLIGTSLSSFQLGGVSKRESALLKKINLFGEVKWVKEFPIVSNSSIRIESIDVLENGDILVGVFMGVEDHKGIGKAILLSPEGDEIREYVFPDTVGGKLIARAIDRNTFCVKWRRSISPSESVEFIEVFNRKGESKWRNDFQHHEESTKSISNIQITDNNEIIGVGTANWKTIINNLEDEFRGGPCWAFKLSLTGELEWEKYYYDPRNMLPNSYLILLYNWLSDIIELPNGDLIMVGGRHDTIGVGDGVYKYNAWIIKTDSNGCLYGHYHCDTLQIVGDSTKRMLDLYTDVVYEWTEEEVTVYPNPASNQLTIELPIAVNGVVRFVNMKGQQILEREIQNKMQLTISINNLIPGPYLVEVFDVKSRVYYRAMIIKK